MKNFKRRLASQSAFSLVEVVFALGIFTFTLMTMMGMMASGLSMVHTSANAMVVSEIAQQVRTGLEKMTVSELSSQPAQTNYFDSQGVLLSSQASSVYQAAVSAPTAPSETYFSQQGAASQLYQVTVTVRYSPAGTVSNANGSTTSLVLISPVD